MYDKSTIKYINYITDSISDIKDIYNKTPANIPKSKLTDLKNSLNKFFNDAKCLEVIYTNNTDKMFFGMCVVPKIETNELLYILTEDNPIRIEKYYIEIDSKLLDPLLGLTDQEITACLLHEIGHLVNTSAPVDMVRKEIDVYLMDNGETISADSVIKHPTVMKFGVIDSIRKTTSMFENAKDEEILADQFVIECGYGDYLISAFKKIQSKALTLTKDVSNKFTALIWSFKLYNNINDRRIAANKTLNKIKKTTGSTSVKNFADVVIKDINKADTLNESNKDDPRAKYKFKYNILRKYEDDYYELALRLKSANIEVDALNLLRDINSRLSVIEEFLESVELQESDRKRFTALYDKYVLLREALSKKNIVKNKHMSLWVEYPDIQ